MLTLTCGDWVLCYIYYLFEYIEGVRLDAAFGSLIKTLRQRVCCIFMIVVSLCFVIYYLLSISVTPVRVSY